MGLAQLNEHQLSVMRITYPGFRDKDAVVRRVKSDERRYKERPGYVPLHAILNDQSPVDKLVHPWSD